MDGHLKDRWGIHQVQAQAPIKTHNSGLMAHVSPPLAGLHTLVFKNMGTRPAAAKVATALQPGPTARSPPSYSSYDVEFNVSTPHTGSGAAVVVEEVSDAALGVTDAAADTAWLRPRSSGGNPQAAGDDWFPGRYGRLARV